MFKLSTVFVFSTAALLCMNLLNAQPHLLPVTGSGCCTAGTKYIINSVDDLKANIADLECIFAAAEAPDAIGLGFNYGTVLMGENAVIVQPFAAPVYQGDYVVRTTCNQKPMHFGMLKVGGITVGTAPWTLAPFTEPTAPGEAPIDPTIDNYVMDFRQNVHDICPIEDLTAMLNSVGFLPFRNPTPPVNCFVDIARVVGRDENDGGIILLSKGMNKDPVQGWQSSLFYALKNFDPEVKPDFGYHVTLKVPKSFDYVHHGFVETFTRFGASGAVPFLSYAKQTILNALVSNPLVAALVLKSGGWYDTYPLTPIESLGPEQVLRELTKVKVMEELKASKFAQSVSKRIPIPSLKTVEEIEEGFEESIPKRLKELKALIEGLINYSEEIRPESVTSTSNIRNGQ